MQIVFEITRFTHGKKPDPSGEGEQRWTSMTGLTPRGARCNAVALGKVSDALNKEIAKIVPAGEDAGTKRLVLNLTGEWGERAYRKEDGSQGRFRRFEISNFDVLTGPHLELARLRRDAGAVVDNAEAHRSSGRLDLAYKAVAEFTAMICGRSMDFEGLEPAVPEEDEIEFGPSVPPSTDPESAAAARYAMLDRAADPMVPAETEGTPEPDAREADDGSRPQEETPETPEEEETPETVDAEATDDDAPDAGTEEDEESVSPESGEPAAGTTEEAPAKPDRPSPPSRRMPPRVVGR